MLLSEHAGWILHSCAPGYNTFATGISELLGKCCDSTMCLFTQSCPTLWDPWTVAHQAPLSMGILQLEYWSGLPCLPPGDLPNPRIKPRSPTLQEDSLPSEPPEKPMYIGVGSLSLLQEIFLTQESNRGLLLCRQILYQLNYPGSSTIVPGLMAKKEGSGICSGVHVLSCKEETSGLSLSKSW